MQRLLPYLIIAVIVTAHGPAAWAQGPPGETEAREEAARRTREIMEMRRRMAEESRVQQNQIIRLHTEGKFTHPHKSDLNWLAEPRGGWTIRTEPDRDPTVRGWNGDAAGEEAPHLVPDPGIGCPGRIDSDNAHEIGQGLSKGQVLALSPNRFGTHPGQQQPRDVAEGEFVVEARGERQREGPVAADILFAVAGVGAGQGTERQEPSEVSNILIGLGRVDQAVDLIETAGMVAGLRRNARQIVFHGSPSSVRLSSGTGQTGSVNQRFFSALYPRTRKEASP